MDLADFGYVGLDGNGFGTVVETLDYFADFICWAFRGHVVYDDGGAALAEFDGAASSNSATGTGDEGDLTLEGGGGNIDDHLDRVTWVGDVMLVLSFSMT